jgi:hypothetical protein
LRLILLGPPLSQQIAAAAPEISAADVGRTHVGNVASLRWIKTVGAMRTELLSVEFEARDAPRSDGLFGWRTVDARRVGALAPNVRIDQREYPRAFGEIQTTDLPTAIADQTVTLFQRAIDDCAAMEETVHKAAEGARPPAVRISDVVTNGDLSVIAVRAILEDIADDLRACYENRWTTNLSFSSRVMVSFELEAGELTKLHVDDRELQNCIDVGSPSRRLKFPNRGRARVEFVLEPTDAK